VIQLNKVFTKSIVHKYVRKYITIPEGAVAFIKTIHVLSFRRSRFRVTFLSFFPPLLTTLSETVYNLQKKRVRGKSMLGWASNSATRARNFHLIVICVRWCNMTEGFKRISVRPRWNVTWVHATIILCSSLHAVWNFSLYNHTFQGSDWLLLECF
jgi:hypothetical protein